MTTESINKLTMIAINGKLTKVQRKMLLEIIDELKLENAKCDSCGYKIHSESISKLNSCNSCHNAQKCEIRQEWGQYCRINCYLWEGEENDK